MEVSIWRGGKAETGEIDTEFLGDVVRVRLLRQAVRMYEMNKRQGTHKVKRRGEIAFRKSPLFKQKGTGRARVRHPSATQCRKGGVPHGPQPRDYSYAIPKRARREATRSALLAKFRDGEVALVDAFAFDAPKTKRLASMLADLGIDGRVLIVTHERDDNLLLSARNLSHVTILAAEDVNAYDLLLHKRVVMTEAALDGFRESTDES